LKCAQSNVPERNIDASYEGNSEEENTVTVKSSVHKLSMDKLENRGGGDGGGVTPPALTQRINI
jgi:hypothetical protein